MKSLFFILFINPLFIIGQVFYHSNNLHFKIRIDTIINKDTILLYPAYFKEINSSYLTNDSLPNGQYNGYYNDKSTLAFTVSYNNKKVNGINYCYSKNGNIEAVGSFKNGVATGPYILYYQNGKVKEIGNLINGELNGPNFSYFENGRIKQSSSYKNGCWEGIKEDYYLDGNIESRGTYQHGCRIGKHTVFYIDGNPWIEDVYIDSIGQNEMNKIKEWEEQARSIELNFPILSTEYDETKNKTTEYLYKHFELIKIIAYHSNGKEKTVTNCHGHHFGSCQDPSFEIKEGLFTEYFENGNKKSEGNYSNNEKHGTWHYYNQNGKLLKKVVHKKNTTK